MLMGDLEPLPLGIIDLRRGNNHTIRVSVASYISRSCSYFVVEIAIFVLFSSAQHSC